MHLRNCARPPFQLAYYGGADLQQPSTFWPRDRYQRVGGLDPTLRAAFDTDLFFGFLQAALYLGTLAASGRVSNPQRTNIGRDARNGL